MRRRNTVFEYRGSLLAFWSCQLLSAASMIITSSDDLRTCPRCRCHWFSCSRLMSSVLKYRNGVCRRPLGYDPLPARLRLFSMYQEGMPNPSAAACVSLTIVNLLFDACVGYSELPKLTAA